MNLFFISTSVLRLLDYVDDFYGGEAPVRRLFSRIVRQTSWVVWVNRPNYEKSSSRTVTQWMWLLGDPVGLGCRRSRPCASHARKKGAPWPVRPCLEFANKKNNLSKLVVLFFHTLTVSESQRGHPCKFIMHITSFSGCSQLIWSSYLLRNIPPLPKVGPDLPSKWDFGHRKGLVPGQWPWSQEAFNIYETSQIKSGKIWDVYMEPYAWQG